MRRILAVIFGGLVVVSAAGLSRADNGPVIAIPSRPGVPIMINGRDASYAVVEGDWGLSRPGAGIVTVIGGSPVGGYAYRRTYHPYYGRAPARGRNEVEPDPNRPLPPPAPTYYRFWSTDPEPDGDDAVPLRRSNVDAPVTVVDPVTFSQPAAVVAPRLGRRRPRGP